MIYVSHVYHEGKKAAVDESRHSCGRPRRPRSLERSRRPNGHVAIDGKFSSGRIPRRESSKRNRGGAASFSAVSACWRDDLRVVLQLLSGDRVGWRALLKFF